MLHGNQRELFAAWDGSFPEPSVVEYVCQRLESIEPDLASLAERVGLEVEEYGRLSQRRDYQYVVWYDIVDSTATEVDVEGGDVVARRSAVERFKGTISGQLRALANYARRGGDEIYCWRGGVQSRDDEKHVFVKGAATPGRYVGDVIRTLVRLAGSCGVQLRIVASECGFAGSRAYRLGSDPEVEGERFWEHLSRVKKAVRQLERDVLQRGDSFLALAGERLVEHFRAPDGVRFVQMEAGTVESRIEGLMRRTRVRTGGVKEGPA